VRAGPRASLPIECTGGCAIVHHGISPTHFSDAGVPSGHTDLPGRAGGRSIPRLSARRAMPGQAVHPYSVVPYVPPALTRRPQRTRCRITASPGAIGTGRDAVVSSLAASDGDRRRAAPYTATRGMTVPGAPRYEGVSPWSTRSSGCSPGSASRCWSLRAGRRSIRGLPETTRSSMLQPKFMMRRSPQTTLVLPPSHGRVTLTMRS
jgi:hypothetical protein